METVQIFSNPNFGQIRTISIDGDPYFAAIDLAKQLGYKKTRNAITRHVDAEDALKHRSLTKGGRQFLIFVNESGMYSLILGSQLPQAKAFKRWVTSEVLPSIRKTGMYKLEAENQALKLEAHTATKVIEMNAQSIREYEDRISDLKRRLQSRTGEPLSNGYTDRLYSVSEIAKMMNMTANCLNKKLETMGIQTREYGTWYLTERFHNYGYTRLRKCSHLNKHGERVNDYITKWTEKGMKFIHQIVSDIDLDSIH